MAPALKQFPVRTAQLLNALQANVSGGWAGFSAYATQAGTLGVDPSSPLWIAIFVEAFVTPSGTLAQAISAYMQAAAGSGGLGLSTVAASTQMGALFTAAAQVGN